MGAPTNPLSQLLFNIADNPILLRELRRRMRGRALIWSITSYISLMTLFTIVTLLVFSPAPGSSANIETLQELRTTGRMIFFWITGIQSLLVLIIAPTITAGMTTGEKERKTFDFLRVTTITRWMYILGCFLSTSFYVGIALLCALPLLSIGFLYGGVSLSDVAVTFAALLGSSCILSSFGLYISSICDRTRTAQGIIVFMIFGLIFSSILVYNLYNTTFQGAQAAVGGANQGIFLFNTLIPGWIVIVAVQAVITGLFLLLAARKLFEPLEMKAFSYSQFLLFFMAAMIVGTGFLGGNQLQTETPELVSLAVGILLLYTAVITFAVGRVELGDEVWHLKRLFTWLRPVDQTIPFLVLIALVWYLTLSYYRDIVPGSQLPVNTEASLIYTTIPCFFFFCAVGRLATGYARNTNVATVYTSSAIIGLLVIGVPVVTTALSAAAPNAEGLWREIGALSPVSLMLDIFLNPTGYGKDAPVHGMLAGAVYTAAAVVTAVIGERKRFLRWRHFNYHYDMPAG